MTSGSRTSLWLAYAVICVVWGSTYLAIKVGLASFDPFFYAGVRYLIATAIMLPFARSQGISFGGSLRRWLPAFAVGFLFIGVCNGTVFWAETSLDSGFTSLMIATAPVWTAFLQGFLPGEPRLGALGWTGIAVGMAGTVVLLAPWETRGVALWASIAVQISTVVWAATSLWVRKLRTQFDPLQLTVAQMAAGGALLLAVSAVTRRAVIAPITTNALFGLGFLAVFGSCVAFAAYFYLLKHWDAARVATSAYINPIVAVALGAVVLGEPVTMRMVAGTVVVFAGVGLVLHEQRRLAGT